MELVRYDAMCHAIAQCYDVDEVADMHNKALALELYAKQARNTDAERQACEIRLRAEKRAGVLFSEMQRMPREELNAGGKNQHEVTRNDCGQPQQSEYRAALESSGVTERTAQRWQELAAVPDEVFEDALRAPDKPSTNGIISKWKSPAKMDSNALWIWGRARDFERDRFHEKEPVELLEGMTDTMRADMERIVPLMAAFFNAFEEAMSYERS